jgi:hypothetical protein
MRSTSGGTDEYGDPIPGGEEPVLSDAPVRYRSGGTEFVRTETGERVTREPSVVGPALLAEEVREGDTVELEPLGDGAELGEFEVAGINESYGRTAQSHTVEVELTDV